MKQPGVAKTLLLELTEGGREVRKRGRIREMEWERAGWGGGNSESQASEG